VIIKNNKIFYLICTFFSIITILSLIENNEKVSPLKDTLCLFFFGGGAIVHYFLENKKISLNTKYIFVLIGCLIFILLSFYALPSSGLEFNSRTPKTVRWIFSISGIIFFGIGFLVSVILLFKSVKENKNYR
jgi:hypothetical protein